MRHDNGQIRIITAATSPESATRIVCAAEHAPPGAVVKVEKL
jgi:hypothetical protein